MQSSNQSITAYYCIRCFRKISTVYQISDIPGCGETAEKLQALRHLVPQKWHTNACSLTRPPVASRIVVRDRHLCLLQYSFFLFFPLVLVAEQRFLFGSGVRKSCRNAAERARTSQNVNSNRPIASRESSRLPGKANRWTCIDTGSRHMRIFPK